MLATCSGLGASGKLIPMKDNLYIGLMSGTSMDAIDAALVSITSSGIKLLESQTVAIPGPVRSDILALNKSGDNEIERMMVLDNRLGHLFADAVMQLLEKASQTADNITAIGSHGQTLRHRPDGGDGNTLQVGNANIIAEKTGITVITDFRRRDMAAGGQGAPLVPAFHSAVFHDNKANRVIVNIGGIANITVLPKNNNEPVTGYDSGPGNLLMDTWIKQHHNQSMDAHGQWAASGKADESLVSALLDDAYFRQAAPKSTGRDYFNSHWLEQHLQPYQGLAAEDVQASLCELTAISIADAIGQSGADEHEIYICGGGGHNTFLISRLQQHMPQQAVTTTSALGLDPDWVEATAFAWLAKQSLSQQAGNLPAVTGATHAVILGGIYPASNINI